MTAAIGTQIATFVVNLATSYLISRINAQDGPRLSNLSAGSGEYGIPMPRAFGAAVRLTGIFIAQADIRETQHTVEDHSEIVGAIGGAVQGFMIGGPIGAAVGAAVGALLGFAAPDQKYYTYSDTIALLFCDRDIDDPTEVLIKLWAAGKVIFNGSEEVVDEEFDVDGRLIWRKWGKNKYFQHLIYYTGHTDQPVDSVLADDVGEDGGYPFSAYVVIENLQLAPFGNSVPTSIEGLVQVKTGQTLADCAEIICAAGGIDHLREVSTTALIGSELQGYALTSETTCWDALKPLMPVYACDAAEVSGQVRFYRRSQSMRATIPLDHMGAHAFGDAPPDKIIFPRSADLDLPQETALTFIDPARDYQANTAASSRSEGNAKSNIAINLPLVLDAGQGASAAALIHWDAWLGRTQAKFSLTDRWLGIEPGVAYAITAADHVVPFRVTRKLRGANGIIEVEALSDESVTYTASVLGSSGTVPDDQSTLFPETRLILIDGAIHEDGHDDYGFYIVMGASEPFWTRGIIQASDDGVNFVSIIDSAIDCPAMGDVTGTLAAGSTTGLDDTLDTTSVLTVVLLHDGMQLESATDAQLDAWKNFCFVGKDGMGEYLQFKTATHVSGSTWQLTNLRRGRRGSDWAIATHTSGEEFALLGQGGVFRIVYGDTSEWGNEFTFRGVTLHQDAEDADEQTFTNTGEGKRPFSPVNVAGTWDGSNNLTITWDSRSRLYAGGLGIDDNAEWDVEITSGAGRSVTVTAETWTYTAADQTTDGITPGDSISGRVRQTSDVNDGRWRNFTLIGPADARELEDDITFRHLEDDVTVRELE